MIRKLEEKDIDRIMNIWFESNRKAHDFISKKYWLEHYEMAKKMIPQSEVYVSIDNQSQAIQGFIGIDDEYIMGIFVDAQKQSHGVGSQLLKFVKSRKKNLTLNVYQKNKRAIQFYLKNGFIIVEDGFDEDTMEKEYTMIYKDK